MAVPRKELVMAVPAVAVLTCADEIVTAVVEKVSVEGGLAVMSCTPVSELVARLLVNMELVVVWPFVF